ncbi:hypothetical protein OE88DRAFT_1729504 [Heliocybe sulcata]|uniref:Uncharacterized protein n=1 Tax=Heliocybe sulcata TaxID=5364 RepID=A0A5C3MW86_9AGAM|nr:hypothetical protein OE88DRAFT_1729504 [Heliocybe sulcata]
MPSSIPLDVADLAGLIIEAVFYGIFLVLLVIAMQLTIGQGRHWKVNNVLVGVTASMAILATMQLAADVTCIFRSFMLSTRGERIAFLEDSSRPVFILRRATLITMLFLSDLFVTYRCWVVWDGSIRVVILPFCLTLASGASGSYALAWLQHSTQSKDFDKFPRRWFIATAVLSLMANAISTSLTGFYIWHKTRRTARVIGFTTSNLIPVAKIVIESGVLNEAYLLVHTITLSSGTEGMETMAALGGSFTSKGTPLIGCIFMLVIIRAGFHGGRGSDLRHVTSMDLRPPPRPNVDGSSDHSIPSDHGRHILISQEVFVRRDDIPGAPAEESSKKPDLSFAV